MTFPTRIISQTFTLSLAVWILDICFSAFDEKLLSPRLRQIIYTNGVRRRSIMISNVRYEYPLWLMCVWLLTSLER